MQLGNIQVRVISDGSYLLDGGLVFGQVPKVVWEKNAKPDRKNRVRLGLNCLLIQTPDRNILIDTGVGARHPERNKELYGLSSSKLLRNLRANGLTVRDIDTVVLTCLHFDHAGGLTHERDGRLAATFPKARVHVQRRELEDARAGFGIMTATYRDENLSPIDSAGGWNVLDGEVEILEGIRSLSTPGHTRGHHSIIIEGTDRGLIYTGDVMPTRRHVGRAYNMGYDLYPLDNRDSKAKMLEIAAARDWLLAIDHEPDVPVVRVGKEKDWYELLDSDV